MRYNNPFPNFSNYWFPIKSVGSLCFCWLLWTWLRRKLNTGVQDSKTHNAAVERFLQFYSLKSHLKQLQQMHNNPFITISWTKSFQTVKSHGKCILLSQLGAHCSKIFQVNGIPEAPFESYMLTYVQFYNLKNKYLDQMISNNFPTKI